jgi:hypothetical protein
MISNITQNWGLMRMIRLALGVYAIIEAVKAHELIMGILGLTLVGMALFNMGCGAQGCGVPIVKNTKTKDQNQDEVEYEEVHSK